MPDETMPQAAPLLPDDGKRESERGETEPMYITIDGIKVPIVVDPTVKTWTIRPPYQRTGKLHASRYSGNCPCRIIKID